MHCEYDGHVLPLTPDGVEDACPACDEDIAAHNNGCKTCSLAPYLPEKPSLRVTE